MPIIINVSTPSAAAPLTENVTLVPSSGTNTTSENLMLSYDSYDANGDAIKNITSWFLNGEVAASVAFSGTCVLQLPR